MDLSSFQNEVNHLLFLYFTSIGVIQRDAENEDIEIQMEALLNEILKCKNTLYNFLNDPTIKPMEHNTDKDEILDNAKRFIEDGLCLIDKIIEPRS